MECGWWSGVIVLIKEVWRAEWKVMYQAMAENQSDLCGEFFGVIERKVGSVGQC